MANTRNLNNIFLLGVRDSESLYRFNQLPTTRQVLLRFHYHLLQIKSVRNASHVTIDELLAVWNKAAIPVRLKKHAIDKLEKIHSQWLLLKKHSNRLTKTQKDREQKFVVDLDILFDISHSDAMTMIKIPEDKNFLKDQRDERKIIISSLDKKLALKNERSLKRKREYQERKEKSEASLASTSTSLPQEYFTEINLFTSSSSCDDDTEDEEYKPFKRFTSDNQVATINTPTAKEKQLLNQNVISALDRNKISDREAMRIIVPIADALGEDLSLHPISRSTLQRKRKNTRHAIATELKINFKPKYPIVVHWDSKILPDMKGEGTVDRLAVIASGNDDEKLLGVPKLASGTGENIAKAVCNLLEEWNIIDKVQGMSFDTTAANTGHIKGACTIIEQKLGRKLMWLACRHHMLELILAKVFTLCLGPSNSPEISLFKRFKTEWNRIIKDQFLILETTADIDSFKESTLKTLSSIKCWPREDYKELIELTMIVLGKIPEGIQLRAPGAIHRARWMAKLIYGIKIYLYRNQRNVFKLSKKEQFGLERFVKFGALLYTKAWIEAPLTTDAPVNDLQFWKDLKRYESIDIEISKTSREVLERHLWYLSDELVGLALFSDNVISSEKKQIVSKLTKNCEKMRKVRASSDIFKTKGMDKIILADFVTKRTAVLFKQLGINTSFLNFPPDEWNQNEQYIQGKKRVKQINVVNDIAERGVKLFSDFNKLHTTDETEKQFLLQVIENNRKSFPSSSTKKELLNKI